jgi:hypothetical protein
MRLIDADELWAGYAGLTRVRDTEWQQGYWDGVDDVVDGLNKMPIVDAVPVVHGRWVEIGRNSHDYETSIEEKCSLCGRYVYRYDTELQDNYCPNCGARMDGEE